MDSKTIKYKTFLNTFSNFAFGAALLVLLLSVDMRAGLQMADVLQQALLFIAVFLTIFHGWWRNYELFTSVRTGQLSAFAFGVLRIPFLLIALIMLHSVNVNTGPSTSLMGWLFLLIAASSWAGFISFPLQIRPLYGKERVLFRRELLTDLFYALILTAVGTAGFFLPESLAAAAALAAGCLVALGSRPLAKSMTQWAESEPPHRGGRPPRGEGRRRPQPRRDRRHQGESRYAGESRTRTAGRGEQRQESMRGPSSQRSRETTGRRRPPHARANSGQRPNVRTVRVRKDEQSDAGRTEGAQDSHPERRRSSEATVRHTAATSPRRGPVQERKRRPAGERSRPAREAAAVPPPETKKSRPAEPSMQVKKPEHPAENTAVRFGRSKRSPKRGPAGASDKAPAPVDETAAEKSEQQSGGAGADSGWTDATTPIVKFGRKPHRSARSRAKEPAANAEQEKTEKDPANVDEKERRNTQDK